MDKREIKHIDIGDIMEHPNNPRKDLGDLSELAESIRIHGVMQNLLVIEREEALEGIREEYEKEPKRQYVEMMDALTGSRRKYIVLLGHRRLAAAEEADLETVPCVVEHGLSLNDQITLMLLENMQRNNLTIVEEAESFQMMLDLGDTVTTVAEKSGFSETTVRHRVELAKLDRKLLKQALKESDERGYQLTLTDLAKLEKVEDVKERNKILDRATSGGQIENGVTRYLEEQQTMKHRQIILDTVEKITGRELGKEPKDFSPWGSKYTTIWEIPTDRKPEPVLKKKETKAILEKLPADAFLATSYHNFVIATKEKAEKKLSKQEQERNEREKRTKEIKKLTKNGTERWKERILEIIRGSRKVTNTKAVGNMTEEVFNFLEAKNVWIKQRAMLIYEKAAGEDDWWEIEDDEREVWIEKYQKSHPVYRMLLNAIESFRSEDLVDYGAKYNDARAGYYFRMMEFMEKAADYEEQDEDFLAIIDGTHELYTK